MRSSRWPDEVCLIEADRDHERSRLTYRQFGEAAEPLLRRSKNRALPRANAPRSS